MRSLLVFSFLFLTCCSATTFSYRSAGPYYGSEMLGTGSYLVEVWFTPQGGVPERFNANFARKAYGTVFEAVSPDGKLLFQARDPMEAAAEPAFRDPPPRQNLQDFYRTFRPLLLLADKPDVPSKVVTERYPDGRPRTLLAPGGRLIHIEEFDWAGHVFRASLEGKEWTATLALREYDVGP
jgi:hypothetical protein